MSSESYMNDCSDCLARELFAIMALIIQNISFFLKYEVVKILPDSPTKDYTGHVKNHFQNSHGRILDSSVYYHNLSDLLGSVKVLGKFDNYLEVVFKNSPKEERRESRLNELMELLGKLEQQNYSYVLINNTPQVLRSFSAAERYSYSVCNTLINATTTALTAQEKGMMLQQLNNLKLEAEEDDEYEENESILKIFVDF
jgi:hypothetical protein